MPAYNQKHPNITIQADALPMPDIAKVLPLGIQNGNAADIKQQVALKILGRSPVERQVRFAQERGWKHLDFVQTVGDDYAGDLNLINDDGSENPALIVFKRDGDEVRLFWASEMTREMAREMGRDSRRSRP